MRKIFWKIIFSLLFSICFSSCITLYFGREVIEINNDYIEIILQNNNKEKSVYQLYLKIRTNIEGKVRIEWNNGENFERIIILENNDKFIYNADYYTNILIIKIYPENNCRGKININYRFYLY